MPTGGYIVTSDGFPSGGSTIGLLARASGINGKTAGALDLYTIPADRQAAVTGAMVLLTAAAGVITPATLGIGIASGEADIIAAVLLTGLTTANRATELGPIAASRVGQGGEIIRLGIDIGFIATTATLAVDLYGYLI